ncbi:MAG TPA: XdhC family protein [Candidatus Competibacter sp.]|nr:XdhC family protein [Candidatus Competibacter sp.]
MDSLDLAVLRRAVEWLVAGRRVALVTVVATWGSAPRPVGAVLALADDGQFSGSVSGGCVEDDLAARRRARFPTTCKTVKYGVTAEEARRFGLPCGGTLHLLVEPLAGVEALRPALAALERGELLARRVRLADGAVNFHPTTPNAVPTFDSEALTQIFGPRWRLLLIGAGQISAYLAAMAQTLDYRVLVCDPRAEYVREWTASGAELLPGMPDDVVRTIAPDRHTAIVALTHDPRLDDMALMEALKTDAFYVGALGSATTTARRRERLVQLEVTPEELRRLRGPVGLPIGSRTPPEIAISVLAELTALRHGVVLARVQPQADGDSLAVVLREAVTATGTTNDGVAKTKTA